METRPIEQLLSEIEELIDPVKPVFKDRDTMVINNKITIELMNDDIIYDEVGAIVNPANSTLDDDYGLSDQIATIGGSEIEDECKEWLEKIGEIPTSNCAITHSGKLECQYVIHTVAPVYSDYQNEEEASDVL